MKTRERERGREREQEKEKEREREREIKREENYVRLSTLPIQIIFSTHALISLTSVEL